MNENQNILFVDADPLMQNTFKARLRQHNHTVTVASKAEEALTLMREHKDAYNLVIIDLHLSGSKDGIAVIIEAYLNQVRGQFWLVSASLGREEELRAYRAGARIVINKINLDSKLQEEGFLPY